MRGMGTPQIPLKYSPNLGQGPKEYQFFWQHPLLTFEKNAQTLQASMLLSYQMVLYTIYDVSATSPPKCNHQAHLPYSACRGTFLS